MSAKRYPALFYTYLVLAALGLVTTWTFNILSMAARENYLGEWFGNGPAVLSAACDLIVILIVAAVFMVIESRRLGMKHVWAYLVAMPLVAVAFALPLFLAMRERALATREHDLRS